MNQKVSEIKEKALKLIEEAKDKNALEDVRVKFLGKKGELTTILRSMGNLSKEERPAMGKLVNEAKKAVEEKLDEVVADLKQKEKEMKLKNEVIDVTLPGIKNEIGNRHPLEVTIER